MNKKQFLSIAMLISIAGLNASAADLQREAGVRAQSMMKNPRLAGAFYAVKDTARAAQSNAVSLFGRAKDQATVGMSAIKDQALAGISFVKANPTTAGLYTGTAAGLGYVAYRQYDNAKNALVTTKNAVVNAAQKGYNSVINNPKTTAALVALTAGAGVGAYYKGDVVLAAAQNAVTKLPNRPEFVNTGLGYVTGAANAVTSYAQKAASYVPTWATDNVITRNSSMALANAPFVVQAGSDVVGLVGSKGSELSQSATEALSKARSEWSQSATAALSKARETMSFTSASVVTTPEVVEVAKEVETTPEVVVVETAPKRVVNPRVKRHTRYFALHFDRRGLMFHPEFYTLTTDAKIQALYEAREWSSQDPTFHILVPSFNAEIAKLQS